MMSSTVRTTLQSFALTSAATEKLSNLHPVQPQTSPPFQGEEPAAFPALTGIRFLAAAYVVLHHFPAMLPASWVRQPVMTRFIDRGYLGVTLFFMLSGFLLAVVYENRIAGFRGCKQFLMARVARLYPVYLLSLALMYKMLFSAQAFHFRATKGVQVLLLVQSWRLHDHQIAGYWNFAAWTLSIEAFFYLCFPLLLKILRGKTVQTLVECLAVLTTICVLAHIPEQRFLALQPDHPYPLPFAVMRLPEFVAGMVLGLLYRRGRAFANGRAITYGGLAGAIALLCWPIQAWDSLIVLPMAALLYGLATQKTAISRLLAFPVLQWLGRMSYAVYLLQLGVYFAVQHAIRRLCPALSPWTPQLFFPVLLAISLAVYKWWEEPLRRGIRQGDRWLDARAPGWMEAIAERFGSESNGGQVPSGPSSTVMAAAGGVRKG